MDAGTRVIINRDGDVWDGSEGTVLDPNTFGEPHTSRWILVQGCVEDEFGLRMGERFYPADALEVIGAPCAGCGASEYSGQGWRNWCADCLPERAVHGDRA